jgi:hypothetical protein
MSKGNKPPKNDKANKKPKKVVPKGTPSGSILDLKSDSLGGIFNTVNHKAGS